MKTAKLFLSFLWTLFICTCSFAAQTPDVVGIWKGSMGEADNPAEMYFQITRSEGALKGTFSAPMFGDGYMNQALSEVSFDGTTLKLGFAQGVYDAASDSFTGTICFFGPVAKAVFRRVDKMCEAQIDTSPGTEKSPAWVFATGGEIWSSPLLVGDKLFTGSDDGCLYALSAADGRLLWKFTTQGVVRGKAAYLDGVVFFNSDDGRIRAVNASDGKLKWGFDAHGKGVPRDLPAVSRNSEWDYAQSSPVIQDGIIFCGGADGVFYAIDAGSGRELWQHKTDARIRASATVAKGLVCFGNWSGKVYALEARTGKQAWVYDGQMPVLSQPAYANGGFIVGSRYSFIWSLDAAKGTPKWTHNYWWSWVESSVVIDGATAYLGSSDGRCVIAFDPATGKRKWFYRTSGYPWGVPAIDGDTIYIGTLASKTDSAKAGWLYVLNKADGTLRYKVATQQVEGREINGVYSQVAFDRSQFYFGATDGKIYAYRK